MHDLLGPVFKKVRDLESQDPGETLEAFLESRRNFVSKLFDHPAASVLTIARVEAAFVTGRQAPLRKVFFLRNSRGEKMATLKSAWKRTQKVLSPELSFIADEGKDAKWIRRSAEVVAKTLAAYSFKRRFLLETVDLIDAIRIREFDPRAEELNGLAPRFVSMIGAFLKERDVVDAWTVEVRAANEQYAQAAEQMFYLNAIDVALLGRLSGRPVTPGRDSIQSAWLSQLEALWQFLPEEGTDFTRYARKGIQARVQRDARKFFSSLGARVYPGKEERGILSRYFRLCHEAGRLIGLEEAADVLGVDPSVLLRLRNGSERAEIHSRHSVFDLEQAPEPRDPHEAVTRATQSEISTRIANVLRTLSYREREILKLRYGLTDGREYTYAQIAEQFGIAPDLARTIERKGLRKLQHHTRADHLAALVEPASPIF